MLCASIVLRIASLELHDQCAPGNAAMVVWPSALRTVNLSEWPLLWQVGSSATVPANRQPLGTSSVAAAIWYDGSWICALCVPDQAAAAAQGDTQLSSSAVTDAAKARRKSDACMGSPCTVLYLYGNYTDCAGTRRAHDITVPSAASADLLALLCIAKKKRAAYGAVE